MHFSKRIGEIEIMGGYGSGRYSRNIKTQVEDCYRLPISKIWRDLYSERMFVLTWSINGKKTGKISYLVVGDPPESVHFSYLIASSNGEQQEIDYPVKMTTTFTPWKTLRWWFICPYWNCGKRVAVLYLPPGGRYFACRHCHNLTYRSCQEQHSSDGLHRLLARIMQSEYPGITPADIRFLLEEDRLFLNPPPRDGYFDRKLNVLLSEFSNYDPWSHWLTEEQLSEQSGLNSVQLSELKVSRLLVPDHGDRYRPKLAGWGRKLAYLLGEGWTLVEIKAWARGRWETPNPRHFPPDRGSWRVD